MHTLTILLLMASLLSGPEKMTYSIRHNLFPGEIGAMTFVGQDQGEQYRVDATLAAAAGGFYTLECTYGSTFCNDAARTPVKAEREQKEKKYWAKGLYDWSAPGTVHMDVTKSTRPHRDETLSWDGTVRDLLGMIWWLRFLDYGEKGVQGDIGPQALLLDHDALPVTIKSSTRKTIRFKGEQVPVIEVVLSQGNKEALRLTLSDDEQRLPLKFSIGLPFGTIKGTIQ